MMSEHAEPVPHTVFRAVRSIPDSDPTSAHPPCSCSTCLQERDRTAAAQDWRDLQRAARLADELRREDSA